MIDLIANGFALRDQKNSKDTPNPQIIRKKTANDKHDEYFKSAQSAYSAKKEDSSKTPITIEEKNNTADFAELAGTQHDTVFNIADLLRKTRGLTSVDDIEEDTSQTPILVSCNCCTYFTPDSIGDGAGIGDCAFNLKWTQEVHGKMPLYRHAERHCMQYKQLEHIESGV